MGKHSIRFSIFPKIVLVLLVLSPIGNGKEQKQYPAMGRAMRSEFLIKEDFILLDHGAYGTMPKPTQASLHAFQERAEANIDLWFRREAQVEINKVIPQLAELINADSEDLVMIPNTTSGMNAIFRSLLFNLGERILHFSTIYGSMGSIIQYVCDTSEKLVTSLVFNVTYPISNAQLVTNFEAFMLQNHDPLRPIRIALIDHITSVPGVILPVEQIISILRQYNVSVLVDGAHAIGQIPIDIKKLAPDYYITNCHKWLYGARGSAVMFVDKKYQNTTHPAHINAAYKNPLGFQEEFFWTGTMDYSPYMSVPAALEFRRQIGGEAAIQNYTHNLAREGGAYLASVYGTEVLQDEDQMGSLVDVRLPIDNPYDPMLSGGWWIDTFVYRYTSLFAPAYMHNGSWWVRHSAQIYNDMSDFEKAAELFLEVCNEINSKNGTITSQHALRSNELI